MAVRLIGLILLSLVLHLLMGVGLLQVPPEWAAPSVFPKVAEVEIIERPSEPESPQAIVRDAAAPESIRDEESKEPARFLSARRQRVVQETRSRRTGLTRNGLALPQNSWMKQEAARNATRGPDVADKDGYAPIPLPGPRDQAVAFEDAPSATGELLPDDVSVGDFTALNTDRFKYYSFYSRVEELVRFRWERGLARAIDSFDRSYLLRIVGKRNWVTSIEFWLTPDGKFMTARVFKESGIKHFDYAAVNAFREAGYFPNPPAEMVGEDGVIKLQYTFNVRWSPSLLGDSSP